tara:strand:+ start:3033 stop:3797 length:765 start_codon:yes stop_codon:yes gene_type:complete
MKVLSIDLDYIMSPSIEIYNSLYFDHNPATRWTTLCQQTPFRENDFELDTMELMYCFNSFIKAIKTSKSVSFGYSHDAILYELDTYEEPIDLINIDHHDDVFGGDFLDAFGGAMEEALEKEFQELNMHKRTNEGNWVGYLASQCKLNSYTWISNRNSANRKWSHMIEKMIPNYLNVTQFDPSVHELGDDFDHVFVCLSPQYLPHRFWHYFAMLISIYEELTGESANVVTKSFEAEYRYEETNDEILYQCTTGRG